MKIKILLILFFNISCLYGQENILTARDAIIEVHKKLKKKFQHIQILS